MGLFGGFGDAIIGGVGKLVGGLLGQHSANSAADVANERNVYNYQHRYRWAMDDIQKAGLNPILAATQGIAGNVNGAAALANDGFSGLGDTLMQGVNSATARKAMENQSRAIDTNILQGQANAKLLESQASATDLSNRLFKDTYESQLKMYQERLANLQKQGKAIDAETRTKMLYSDVLIPAMVASHWADVTQKNSSAAVNYSMRDINQFEAGLRKQRLADERAFPQRGSTIGALTGLLGRLGSSVSDSWNSGKYGSYNGQSYGDYGD